MTRPRVTRRHSPDIAARLLQYGYPVLNRRGIAIRRAPETSPAIYGDKTERRFRSVPSLMLAALLG
ncbi:hypothetical protein [Lonsdalea populi]|uniref:hypothetical protein n=1 Tax=Lonsdalea populi TaxID=1172565 RepID=UPI00111C62F2|nr:hypothetical protein [Lonsdalea populi]QPQ24837.1 hypothetical protein I6N93_03260 [Lonsdalea populi]